MISVITMAFGIMGLCQLAYAASPQAAPKQPNQSESGGPSEAMSGSPTEEEQKSLGLVDWYRQHYSFISMEDTVFTFESEFTMPVGFRRPDSSKLSPFQNWVSHFPLWHQWKPVGIWKGGKAFERDEVARVVHLPWKGRNFRDCAIPLRILAEFLHYQQRELDLQVTLTQGDALRYEKWLTGKAYYGGRGEVVIKPDKPREPSLYEYYRYLDFCMRNTTYQSLANNCDSIAPDEAAPGDLFIAYDESRRQGCAYVIMNVLESNSGERLYAVATGCPEACDFYIPLFNKDRNNPWITRERITSLGTGFANRGFYRFTVQ